MLPKCFHELHVHHCWRRLNNFDICPSCRTKVFRLCRHSLHSRSSVVVLTVRCWHPPALASGLDLLSRDRTFTIVPIKHATIFHRALYFSASDGGNKGFHTAHPT